MKKGILTLVLALAAVTGWAQCITFHNLPYAHAGRYEEPVMVKGWDRSRDYAERGPQCPQTGTTNEMYEADTLVQSEDCLVLTINTPSMSGKAPVAVYIHGGSHHHGSGEWSLYDPAGLTEEQGIVTVNISFRHGVFGYLYDEKNGDSNLGSRDIICALRWIQENIADFGGDPSMVTVFGQSAGAQSVVYVMSMLDEKLFKRAMVFSSPFALTLKTEKSKEIGEKFDGILEAQGLTRYTATQEQLVEAEIAYKKEFGGMMPFAPSGCEQMPETFSCGVEDVLVAYQKDDAAMWIQDFKKKSLEEYGTGADRSLENIATAYIFRAGAKKYTKYLQKHGVNAECFCFTYRPENANWGAAHGIEMGLLYGPAEAYLNHNLMGTMTAEELAPLRSSFRKTVADYVRTGVWSCEFGK